MKLRQYRIVKHSNSGWSIERAWFGIWYQFFMEVAWFGYPANKINSWHDMSSSKTFTGQYRVRSYDEAERILSKYFDTNERLYEKIIHIK